MQINTIDTYIIVLYEEKKQKMLVSFTSILVYQEYKLLYEKLKNN